MSIFKLSKGHDLRLAGKPAPEVAEALAPQQVAVQPTEFRGLRPKLLVSEGERVKVGTPLFADKSDARLQVLSPGGGTVAAIRRGARRVLEEIVIALDGEEDFEPLPTLNADTLAEVPREEVVSALLGSGQWVSLRQRPFGSVPHVDSVPKAIFVQGMDTEPLALDLTVALENRETDLQAGLNILGKLTEGSVHLCTGPTESGCPALADAVGVERHEFHGPHPAGNPGTHIHFVAPVKGDETVWYLRADEVADLGRALTTGRYPVERLVALSGPAVANPCHLRTRAGAAVSALTADRTVGESIRYVSGTVLNGTQVGSDGFCLLGRRTLTVLPEGGRRQFFGWALPGGDKYTLSRTYPSGLAPRAEYALDTSVHGGARALIDIGQYDAVMPLHILPVPLIKAILCGDLEEAEQLGMLELTEPDLALCTFVCPSKTDFGVLLRQGLDQYEKEG